MKIRKEFIERFFSKIKKGRGCWNWMAAQNGDGYGTIKRPDGARLNVSAHRISWEIHNGKINADLNILHRCDNRLCVNPKHLWVGSRKDNNTDCAIKGRHSSRRLSAKQVNIIRALYKNKLLIPSVAANRFGITFSQILRAAKRKTYAEVK